MTIKEVSLECTVALGNFKNIKIAATGENITEVKEYLADSLESFGNTDPQVKKLVDSYIKRVLSETDIPEEITCETCEGKGTNICATCPQNRTKPEPESEFGKEEKKINNSKTITNGKITDNNTVYEKTSENKMVCSNCGADLDENQIKFSKMMLNRDDLCQSCVAEMIRNKKKTS